MLALLYIDDIAIFSLAWETKDIVEILKSMLEAGLTVKHRK